MFVTFEMRGRPAGMALTGANTEGTIMDELVKMEVIISMSVRSKRPWAL